MSTTKWLKYYPWVNKEMMPDIERKKRIKLERDSPGTRESFPTTSFLSQASSPWFPLSLPSSFLFLPLFFPFSLLPTSPRFLPPTTPPPFPFFSLLPILSIFPILPTPIKKNQKNKPYLALGSQPTGRGVHNHLFIHLED